MIKTELKTAPLSIRIRPSLKAAIERLAADDRRSVAEFVEIVLEDYVNKASGDVDVRVMNATSKNEKASKGRKR